MKTNSYTVITDRYVKALFDLAVKARVEKPVAEQLAGLAAAIDQTPLLKDLLNSPLRSASQKSQTSTVLAQKLKLEPLVAEFLKTLAAHQRLALLPQIAAAFTTALQTHQGEITAEIVSAKPLSAAEITQLANVLGKAYGKQVLPSVKQDASLLGGLVITIGGRTIDSSLKGKLDRLQQTLKNVA